MIKHVYRYDDRNLVGDGAAGLVLTRRAVVKETDCYVYHVPANEDVTPWLKPENLGKNGHFGLYKRSYYYPLKTRKGAERSKYHCTKEEALTAYLIRKSHQVARLKLTLERIQLIDSALLRDGFYMPNVGESFLPIRDRIVKAPRDGEVNGGIGPESENYNWMEY